MADVNRLVYFVLVVGMAASTALFAVGLALTYAPGAEPTSTVDLISDLPGLIEGLAEARPSSILCFATLILVLTPVARILVCALVFLADRDLRFALLSFVVLSIIVTSALMGVLLGIKPAA